MSYRSQVGLAIQSESLSKLIDSEQSDQIKAILDSADIHLKNDVGAHLFMWNSIKWYSFEEPISCFMTTLRSLDDQSSFLLLELGENADDVSETGSWYSNDYSLGITRQLSYDSSDGFENV